MKEQLELKHLAPYLPYGLKIIYQENKIDTFLNVVNNDSWLWLSDKKGDYYTDIKPILRPLSDLTKEIEYNGEKFVPLLELYKLSEYDDINDYKIVTRASIPEYYTVGIRVLNIENEFIVLSFSIMNGFATQKCTNPDVIEDRKVDLTKNQLLLWDKLYEWHFDVFGLIDKGLALSYNDL